ncbi:MAG: haloacid dehalogenase-like hydrolase [Pseudoclavibacter sp.]
MTTLPPETHTDVIVYDLDGVITTRDSFTALIIEQLRRSPLRLVRALPAAVTMFLSMREERRREAAARVTAIALAGLRDGDYAELAATFGNRIGGDQAWVRAATVERIRRQRVQGARIIIATATERRLAEALLERAGAPYDLLSASVLVETMTGMEVSDHRVGARKLEALREHGIAIEEGEFVTDSLTDLPTARAAARVILIGASEKTRERYAQAGIMTANPTI